MSLGCGALLTSYIISTSCVALRRWRNRPLPPARWTMGKFTPYCDVISVFVLCFLTFFSFWPLSKNPAPADMNWAVVIYGSVVILAGGYYIIRARKTYKGPVTRVKMM